MPRRPRYPELYGIVRRRDGGRCVYCRRVVTRRRRCQPHRPADGTLDHLIPACRGGAGDVGNLALACHSCNQAKGCLLPLEFIVWRIEQGKG